MFHSYFERKNDKVLTLLWVLAMVLYASLCLEGLTSKMVSLGLRHSKKFTFSFWFMVVWPPLWLKKRLNQHFFQNIQIDLSFNPKFSADQEFYNFMGSEMKSIKDNYQKMYWVVPPYCSFFIITCLFDFYQI